MKNATATSGNSLFSFLFSSKSALKSAPKAKEYTINDECKITVKNGFSIQSIESLSNDAIVFQHRKKCACTEMLYNLDENVFYVADKDDVDFASHDKSYLIKMDQYIDRIKEACDQQNLSGAFSCLLMSQFKAMAEFGDNLELSYGLYLPTADVQNPWQKLKETDFDLEQLSVLKTVI